VVTILVPLILQGNWTSMDGLILWVGFFSIPLTQNCLGQLVLYSGIIDYNLMIINCYNLKPHYKINLVTNIAVGKPYYTTINKHTYIEGG
jgi:hypothetical protein